MESSSIVETGQLRQDPDVSRDSGDRMDAAAWRGFVASEIEDSCCAYLAKPEFLLGHFRAERHSAGDYAGR